MKIIGSYYFIKLWGNTMKKYAVCDECKSKFLKSSSVMESLCPECASVIYGYPNCSHIFKDGRCIHCYWDGSRSDIKHCLVENDKDPNN